MAHTLRQPEQLRVLANGVRQELVDTLGALGGQATVRELATQLGRPMDGLYYHLRQLQQAGLIEQLSADRSGERHYRLIAGDRARLQIDYAAAPPQDLLAVVQSLLRVAESDFRQGLSAPDTVCSGPARELWAGRNKGWLDAEGLREANQLIERLTELLRQGPRRPDDRLYALSFVLAPQNVREPRR
ncbi:MAG: helix-turn-helix domain-containing protein [Lysobacterales bacterium]